MPTICAGLDRKVNSERWHLPVSLRNDRGTAATWSTFSAPLAVTEGPGLHRLR